MFKHSVKVPRHYKVAANIFKEVSTKGGSVKTLLYDEKLRHFRTNVLYALITETIKHSSDIDKIFENSNILKNEQRLDPWLAKILTAELLFGKKTLPGKSKPEQTILSYKEQFDKCNTSNQDILKTEVVRRPRYVRINTNLLTTSDAIGSFQNEGYRFVRCTSSSYDDYLTQIQNLSEYDFTQDYHVKTIFVFSSGTKLHDHDLYLESKIILQDKATALAVHLLAPPSGSVALDMCAAPGMKTTQLAAYMRNQGKIIAVERNEKRYQTLCDFVEKTGSKCVETLHKDVLEIRRGEHSDVEYILLDPSCSGSGMELSVHNYIDPDRLAKLTSLQEKFLKHAMNAFPKAKRIVYSTCSVLPEENERVVTNVVKTSRTKWRVQDVKDLLKGQWNNVGSGMYGSIGTRCMYAKPDSDFTIGFFLAVLDRDAKDIIEKNENRNMYNEEKSKNQNTSEGKTNGDESKGKKNKSEEITEEKILKKKKKKILVQDAVTVHNNFSINKEQLNPSKLIENNDEFKNQQVNNQASNEIISTSEHDLGSIKIKKKKKTEIENDELYETTKTKLDVSERKKTKGTDVLDKDVASITERELFIDDLIHSKKNLIADSHTENDERWQKKRKKNDEIDDGINNVQHYKIKRKKKNKDKDGGIHVDGIVDSEQNLDISLKIKNKNKSNKACYDEVTHIDCEMKKKKHKKRKLE